MLLAVLRNRRDIGPVSQQSGCPYDCLVTDICAASLSSMTISAGSRQIYCSNDNYDNCPIFLAKSLRRR